MSSNGELLPAGVDEDDLDAMDELIVVVQKTINGCVNEVLPLTDYTRGNNYLGYAQIEVNRIQESILKRIRQRTLTVKEKAAWAAHRAKESFLRFEKDTINGFNVKIKKVKDLKKWLPKIIKALNIILGSLQKIFSELEIVKEFKDHFSNAADLESIEDKDLERDFRLLPS